MMDHDSDICFEMSYELRLYTFYICLCFTIIYAIGYQPTKVYLKRRFYANGIPNPNPNPTIYLLPLLPLVYL